MKYDVFISYSRKDSEITDQIYECLEYNNISAFIDREGISGGEEFSPVIAEHIKESILFLFIGSKNSYVSKWTSKELHFALNHKENNAIIPYLIDDENLPEKIEFAIADLNVRNIKEHPIETKLVEDIKTALEKLRPRNMKEDVAMAKAIAERIISSSHSVEDNIQMLIDMSKLNMRRDSNSKIMESEVYLTHAIKLYESNKGKSIKESPSYNSLYVMLGDIKKEKEKYTQAEELYNKYIAASSNLNIQTTRRRGFSEIVDCLISLAEVQVALKKYDEAEKTCIEAQNNLVNQGISWDTSDKAQHLAELLAKVLLEQKKNDEALKVQDDMLALFRGTNSNGRSSFSDMLVRFALSNKEVMQWEIALKYLQEASSLEPANNDIQLHLAETYDALGMTADAYSSYMNVFSNLMKEGQTKSFGFYRNFEKTLADIVCFLDKHKYSEEINKCFLLSIAKYRIDSYNKLVDAIRIGQLYEDYADWLITQKRYNDAKSWLKECFEIIELMDSDNQAKTANYVRISCKISLIHYTLSASNLANAVLNNALDKLTPGISSRRLLEVLFTCWRNFSEKGFNDGAKKLHTFLIDNYKKLDFDDDSKKVSYYTQFGWYMLLMEDYDSASAPLEEALKLEMKHKRESGVANAKNNLARLYIHTDKCHEAKELLDDALVTYEKLAKKDNVFTHNLAESQCYYGQLLLKQEKFDEAEAYFEISLKNYTKAASLDQRHKKDVEETKMFLEKSKVLQNDK